MATKTEIERLSVVETKVDGIAEDVKDIKTTLNTEVTAINTKIDNLDNKYAAKWVQSAVAFVVGIIVSAVLVALIALVVIKPNATATPENPSVTDTQSSDGGVNIDIPKVTP